MDISSTHCKRKTNELLRFQRYFVTVCRWKGKNKRTLVEFLMFIWPLKINWMNEYVRCSFAFHHEKNANYYPSLEYIRMYSMLYVCIVKIRDNWKWDSFALSNSMHARFNIYNGSCIKTTKNTTTEPHKTSDDDERNNHNNKQYASVHIASLFGRSFIRSFCYLYARSLISLLVFIQWKTKTHRKKIEFLLKILNTGKRCLLSEKHFLHSAIHRRPNNSILIRFNEFSTFLFQLKNNCCSVLSM